MKYIIATIIFSPFMVIHDLKMKWFVGIVRQMGCTIWISLHLHLHWLLFLWLIDTSSRWLMDLRKGCYLTPLSKFKWTLCHGETQPLILFTFLFGPLWYLTLVHITSLFYLRHFATLLMTCPSWLGCFCWMIYQNFVLLSKLSTKKWKIG